MWTTVHTQTGFSSMALPPTTQALPSTGFIMKPPDLRVTGGSRTALVSVVFTAAGGVPVTAGAETGLYDVVVWLQSVNRMQGFSPISTFYTLGGCFGFSAYEVQVPSFSLACPVTWYAGISVINVIPPQAGSASGFYVQVAGVRSP